MMRFRLEGSLSGPVIVIVALLTLAACGGGEATGSPIRPAPTATVASAVTPRATALPAPTAAPTAVTPQPTETLPAAAAGAPSPTATATTAPTVTPTPETTATPIPAPATPPVLLKSVDEFGFVLKLDKGANVQTTGWTEPEPDALQGTLSFSTGGVNVILIWGPQQRRAPLAFLADTYNILRGSQPDLTFEPISEGEITVSSEAGTFGGVKTLDADGAVIGGGIIGAWVCSTSETAFRLTLAGGDATLVQLRFDRLLDNFTCPS